MRKSIKIIVSISFFLFSIVFFLQLLTTRVLFNSYNFDGMRSLAYKLNNEFPESKTKNEFINNIYYDIENDSYKIFIDLKFNDEIEQIKIDNNLYSATKVENNLYYFYFNPSFRAGYDQQTFKIDYLVLESESIYANYSFTLYKDIDPNIIYNKQKSIVGVSLGNVWGSGIIIDKNEITKNNLFGKEKKLYEYTIITAYHVIDRNLKISIHYNNTYNTYGDVKVIKTFKDNSDLAFLKLTTTDNSLIPLDDIQLVNNEAVNYFEDDIVFLIGSPMNKSISFNQIRAGKIVNTFITINLKGDKIDSIQTTASLTGGSSGGALFNKEGNLIGLHFAGDNNNLHGYAIHIETILAARESLATYNIENSKTIFTIKKHLFENRCFFSFNIF